MWVSSCWVCSRAHIMGRQTGGPAGQSAAVQQRAVTFHGGCGGIMLCCQSKVVLVPFVLTPPPPFHLSYAPCPQVWACTLVSSQQRVGG
jgi:hypothetical protein